MTTQPGRRFSALIEFKGEKRIIDDIRARDADHARRLLDKRRERFFRHHQIPIFQQKTYALLALFSGTVRFAD